MATKTKNSTFVRITIDPKLAAEIEEIQKEFPLLSVVESVKLILSRGIKKKSRSPRKLFSKLKKSNPILINLDSEAEMFDEWGKFNSKADD